MTTFYSQKLFGCSLGLITAALIIAFGFQGVSAQEGSTPLSPWEGKKVFEQKGCQDCHAVQGKGGRKGPDLGKKKFYGTYLDLATRMWNHLPKMAREMKSGDIELPEFSPEEMRQLIGYLSYQRYRSEPGSEFTGRKLLKRKKCFSCHKFGGKGGDAGPDISQELEILSPLTLVEHMWNHGPDMMSTFEEEKIKRPELSGSEISDIAVAIQSYMQSGNRAPVSAYDMGEPAQGKKVVEEKGCLKCHSIHNVGGDIGPDFADMDLNCSVTQIAGKMWNHAPKMWDAMQREGITVPKFQPGEMADVIAFLYGIQFEDPPGQPDTGHDLIREKNCLACHTLQGDGAGIAKDFTEMKQMDSPLSMITAMWNHAPDMIEKRAEQNVKWPKFKGKEMADLWAYLSSTTVLSRSQH